MSKLGCSCGEVIRDNTDRLPYKGELFADAQFFDLFDRISAEVAGYIRARLAGTERKWLAEHFADDMPMSDEDLVQTIVSRHLIDSHSDVYQCPKCGRLHVVRRDGSNRFDSFAPDNTPHRDVFKTGAG
jgi:predicted RNA-binding Zn-ribbon protein involved in translation (DUF1610 family)